MKENKIVKLIQISLQSADIADNLELENSYLEDLGLGSRAYSRYLRNGVKSVIDLQDENVELKRQIDYIQETLSDLEKFNEQVINVEELKIIYKDRNKPHNLTLTSREHDRPDIDNNNKNKNKIKNKNKNIEIDDNNISKNFNDEEKITVDYYYRLVKNNTSKNDIDLVVNAINQYGWKNILYTLRYLKNEQKANITSFKYVDKVLANQKPLDEGEVEYVVNSEIRNIKCNDYQQG